MSGHDRDCGEHVGPSEYAYDPELPFLAMLEREITRGARRAARQHEHAARAASTPHPARGLAAGHAEATLPNRRRARRGAGAAVSLRIARRSLTLVGLLCLIGASAYGAHLVLGSRSRSASDPTSVPQGAFVTVARGAAGSEQWSLRLYRRGEDMCRVLVVEESVASRCAPAPGARGLAVTSALGTLRRYFFGVTGGDIAKVRIRVGNLTRTVATQALHPGELHAAALPAGKRYFVAIIGRPLGQADPPALMRGLDTAGMPVGIARVDCVQTPNPRQPCPAG